MGQRLRALALLVVLLGAGALLGSSVAQWWAPAMPRPPMGGPGPIQGRVRVEVLNAGGTPGVARDATAALRKLGLDVVYYGNAANFSEELSVVLDRVGELDTARTVADALGIREVVSEPDSGLFVDVTVRLGPDWSADSPTEVEGGASEPWWDLRRFLRRSDSIGQQ